jgi:ligand-binding sensor domain-containing protein/anti-sigma regulatory factor (Ser/Thr protein kinase)
MLMKLIKYSLLIVLLLVVPSLAENHKYTFRHLKVEDGLSQSTILSIIQDKKGYMWFGTGNGLNKYNGYSFVIYSNIIDDPSSISSNAITSIYEDSKGTLWIGTVDGVLNRYNREYETFTRFNITEDLRDFKVPAEPFYDYPVSFSRNNNNSITTIAEDNKGRLWAGTWGKGIIMLDPLTGIKEHYYKGKDGDNSLSHNRITKIIKDSYGTLWIGTMGGGLNLLNIRVSTPQFTSYTHNKDDVNSISDNKIIALLEDKNKNIWVGTYNNGLNKVVKTPEDNNEALSFINYNHSSDLPGISSNTVMSLLQDELGYIWIGTFGGGLDRFDSANESFLNFRKNRFDENSLADDEVLALYEDLSGIIWIGTHLGRGISKLERNKIKFNHLKITANNNSLNDDLIWSIYKDKEDLWVGTYKGGLNRLNSKGKFSYYTSDPSDVNSISDNHVRSIRKDFNGNLWIGTYSGGLNKFNPSTGKFLSFRNNPSDNSSIGANQVLSIVIAPDSVFWIGTFGGGLNYFKYTDKDKIQFSKYVNIPGDENSLSDNRVYSVFRTKDGVIWAGSFGGGLNKLDASTGTFKRYRYNPDDPSSLSHDRVMAVYEDSKGRMWISTYGGGLNLFDRNTEKFKVYTRKQGLASDVLYGVLEDNQGNLWISTDNGLFKFYPDHERFVHFDLDDGLQSQEFSGGAFFKTAEGELFFGGINGVNYFFPDSISENDHIPPLVVSSVKISGEQYNGEVNELHLSYDQNILTFEFAALDFTNPVNNHYEYILEGLESDWQTADARYRIANYTNLSPGTYYFKVKGSNNDEVWNTEAAVIKIIISPPFWKEWWFLSLALLLAGLTIYYLSTIRIRNLLAIEKLKTKLAADLHDNIGAGLTEISILSELAVNDLRTLPDNYSGKLRNISETARQLIDNMSDIVWVVNPKRDSLNDLIIRLKDAYADLLSGMDISLKTFNIEKLEDVKLPMEYKQNLFMILKEGINNSIKHSFCKKITIETNLRNDIIEIIIRDDGIGISEFNMELGNGLKNIEARARALGAKVKWRSSKGSGTTLTFVGRIRSRGSIIDAMRKFREQI